MTPRVNDMTESQPKAITKDLIERINHLQYQKIVNGHLNDIEFQKINHEVNKLYNVSFEETETIKGMLACLKADEVTCRKHHENAINIAHNPKAIAQYILSLINLDHIEEALGKADSIFEYLIWNEDFLLVVLHAAEHISDISRYRTYLDTFQKMTGKEVPAEFGFPEDETENMDKIIEQIEQDIEVNPNKVIECDEKEFKDMLSLAKEIENKT